jgi:hypothetical protein
MISTANHRDFVGGVGGKSAARRRDIGISALFLRMRNAFFGWSGGIEDANAAALMARSGGRLTDSLERFIACLNRRGIPESLEL